MTEEGTDLNPFIMLLDALRWNMLNVVRVELFFNCYHIWNLFLKSSIHSQEGQYAIASLLITLLAHLSIQFSLSWLLTFYTVYLALGFCVWVYRRVYFYHRRRGLADVNQAIDSYTLSKSHHSNNNNSNNANSHTGTLKPDKHQHTNQTGAGSSSSNSASSSSPSTGAFADFATNSLHRQQVSAYKDFQQILRNPRRSPKEFALSLCHLSHISKLFASEDVFDEMHFQILATRRDVLNIITRAGLIGAATLLAYIR